MKNFNSRGENVDVKSCYESELNEILEKIYISRSNLNSLIEREDRLCNTEIMEVSKMLDELLNEYEKLVEKNKALRPD